MTRKIEIRLLSERGIPEVSRELAPQTPPRSESMEFESVDGLSYAEIKVTPPDGPWPAMVAFEPDDFSSLLPSDARRLAQMLILAAVEAEGLHANPPESGE